MHIQILVTVKATLTSQLIQQLVELRIMRASNDVYQLMQQRTCDNVVSNFTTIERAVSRA
jgi:hypothetical protein